MRRRAFLGGFGAILAGAGAAYATRDRGPRLRVGVMTNLTHAPLLAGLGSGRIARALPDVRIETLVFRAGPRVCEALVGGAIDVGTAGPSAIVVHHARHGQGLAVLGGCASGGASFVTRAGSGITGARDLHGKRLAVTQIGTTQDVALRTYLRKNGLADKTAGGDVSVLAVSSATILEQMRRADLDGAWLAEPWATRLCRELKAERMIDERDLWPGKRFSTAAVVTLRPRARDPLVTRFAEALAREVDRARDVPGETHQEAYAELKRHVGNPGSRAIFDAAWSFVDFTRDPERASIERFGQDAHALGLCPADPTAGLFG